MINKYYNIGKNQFKPIYRSITGKGNLKTLKIIQKNFPKLKIKHIKSGQQVFDWKVPKEWNIVDAFVRDKNKKKIISFKNNFLHVVGYSKPINKTVSKKELIGLIHSIPNLPNAIPYVVAYYKKNYYGFCCSENQKKDILKKYNLSDKFEIKIDSSFKKNGRMYYGELLIKGKSSQEILISTYICHPWMANNEISGPIVSMCLINYFSKRKNNEKSLRFIFLSETIGSISYLNKNLSKLKKNIIGGYNLTCIGDEKKYSYMLSKYGKSLSDRVLINTFKELNIKAKRYSFLKRGSDERQYNSPGIDLPISSIFRSKYKEYKEYHTSLDDFDLVTKKGISESYILCRKAILNLSTKVIPKSKLTCEPNMGKRGLYSLVSSNKKTSIQKDLLNFLTYSDGSNDLNDISKYICRNISETKKILKILLKNNLVKI